VTEESVAASRRTPVAAPDSFGRARKQALAWGLFLFVLTSWPSPPSVPVVSQIPSFDKIVHGVLYGVEAFLLYQAIRWPGRPGFALSRALVIVGFLAVMGTADETHQAFIPGRSMEAMDAVGDTTGAALGVTALAWSSRRRERKVEA
jgi:VanZ family protein